MFRGLLMVQAQNDVRYSRVMGDSAARFHVLGSFHTGKSCSILAGTGPLSAIRLPRRKLHQSCHIRYLKYSPPVRMSCRPAMFAEKVKSSRSVYTSWPMNWGKFVPPPILNPRSVITGGYCRSLATGFRAPLSVVEFQAIFGAMRHRFAAQPTLVSLK